MFLGLSRRMAQHLLGAFKDASTPGSCEAASGLMARCPGLGGTELQEMTAMRDVVRAVTNAEIGPCPADYDTRAPPGPGARCALDLFETPTHKAMTDADIQRIHNQHYCSRKTEAGAKYQDRLDTIHAWLVNEWPYRQTLFNLLPEGRIWAKRDTQSSLCLFWKYMCWRSALVHGDPLITPPRVYDNRPAWDELL